jgi:serine/threonine-protein kinase
LNESRVLRSNFTQIWQSGLVNKFNATAFVPLEKGCELKGGSLKIIEQLSFGGLSAVYCADLNGRDVIVKELAVAPSDDLSYFKAKELFDREADLLMNIDHPRIAKLRDFFVENGRHYLVLNHIKGVDLRERVINGGKIPEDMALEWCAQVADTLSFLHECIPSVVHRDITPDNLVLRSDNTIAIIDFGAASQFLSSATGTMVGKQSYVSPEQFRGKAVPASDLYSLAATLYFLLSGQDPEPLTPSSPSGIVTVSEGTSRFIIGAMSLNPKERPVSARMFAKEARFLIAPPLIAS